MQGGQRLIITSIFSAKGSKDRSDFKTKAMLYLAKTTIHGSCEEIVSVAEIVWASDLEWTIVRLALLNDKPKSGIVKVGFVGTGEVGTQISCADIANFLLKQIGETKYLREAPAISN